MDLLSLRLKRAQDAWHSRKSAPCADCHQPIPEPLPPGLAVETGSGIGDALIVTDALHRARQTYPDLPIAVITGHSAVFDNSPDVDYVVRRPHKQRFLATTGKGWATVHATKTAGKRFPNYGHWLESRGDAKRKHPWSDWNNDPDVMLCNAVQNTTMLLNSEAGLHIRTMGRRPRLYLTPEERANPPVRYPYWLVVSGAESSKEPRLELIESVVAKTAKDVHWIQFGYDFKRAGWTCKHPDIAGVAEDRRGQLPIREFFRWLYHAKGVMVPEGGMSHAAAALGTPCVLLGGGRSTPGWVNYDGQAFFHTVGQMKCCPDFGCWVKRCPYDRLCYLLIDPEEVAETVRRFDREPVYPHDLAQPREAPSPFDARPPEHLWNAGAKTAFLCCAGPSLTPEVAEQLDARGLVTFAINRAVHAIKHPTYFAMADDGRRYPDAVWADPTVTKFVKSTNRAWIRNRPGVVVTHWADECRPEQVLEGPAVPLGLAGSNTRSTMFAAVGVLVRLGYTTINIVGADFRFDPDRPYCVPFQREERYRDIYPQHFAAIERMFRQIQPLLRARGVRVYNCTPGSRLNVFERKALADAIREARAATGDPAVPKGSPPPQRDAGLGAGVPQEVDA